MQGVARVGEGMIREVPEQWESWFTVREFFLQAERFMDKVSDKEPG